MERRGKRWREVGRESGEEAPFVDYFGVDGVAEEDGLGKVNEERGDRDGDDEGGKHG